MLSAIDHLDTSPFYTPRRRSQDCFAVASASDWESWSSAEWVFHAPSAREIPRQGWKIHVSTTPDRAQDALDAVARLAREHGVAFKHLPDHATLLLRNSKNCARQHAGKFIALFPDDDRLAGLLGDLERDLSDFDGPYVLSDRRWASAPVFLRYGLFVPHTTADGVPDTRLRDPAGRPVDDDRSLRFSVPEWVPVPKVLAPWLADTDSASRADLPFEVSSALTYSNAGGIYAGRFGGEPVVIREARPCAGLDRIERDAVARLDQERAALAALEAIPEVPTIRYRGRHWEHHYLVTTRMPGEQLQGWLLRHEPRQAVSDAEGEAWATTCHDILSRLRSILDGIHAAGWAHLDVHPGNVLIDPDDATVSLIDFENACELTGESVRAHLAAPGYHLPGAHDPRRHDRYGLSRIAAAMLWISSSEGVVEPTHLATVLAAARADTNHPWLRPHQPAGRRLLDLIETLHHDAMGSGEPPTALGAATPLPPDPDRDWTSVLAAGSLAAAHLHEQDRRYPVHHRALAADWHGLGSGDAIIDRVLGRVPSGDRIPAASPHRGLMTGLTGELLAYAGTHRDQVADLVAERLDELLATPGVSVFSGRPGVLIGLLHLARAGLAPTDRILNAVGDTTTAYLGDPEYVRPVRQNRGNHPDRLTTGLLHGNLGWAWLAELAARFQDADVTRLWDVCAVALEREVAAGVWADGRFLADQGSRGLSYLASGSAGYGLVLSRVPRDLWPAAMEDCLPGLIRACDAPGAMFVGLFNGYAGLQLGHARLATLAGEPDAATRATDRLRNALTRQSVGLATTDDPQRRAAAICGDGWRLTTDVATGNAGVIVALRGMAGSGDLVDLITGDPGIDSTTSEGRCLTWSR